MSKYTTQLLPHSPISGKKVEADFDGGEVTSDASVLLLQETETQIAIISAIASAIRDLRDLRYVDHQITACWADNAFSSFSCQFLAPNFLTRRFVVY